MLLRAAGRRGARTTREAIDQALASLVLWWSELDVSDVRNINFTVDHWAETHHQAVDAEHVRRRKLSMLLPLVRGRRSGAQTLAVALRLPA